MEATAGGIIAALGLARHPEGGWYAETFRDAAPKGARAHSSAIYFLLQAGETSRWHRVKDAAEVWHFYAGAPLQLARCEAGGAPDIIVLGNALASGERPQAVVPAGWWQTARSLGAWTLCGCTVAPAFDFQQFELAEPGFSPVGPV
jgi:predicted cupin superfamily sugar epimerase